jgi:uncharacterized protein
LRSCFPARRRRRRASGWCRPPRRRFGDRFGGLSGDRAFGAYQRGFYKTALELARERAERGDADAQILAAELLSRGLGVRRDLEEAARLYEAAALQGDAEAQVPLRHDAARRGRRRTRPRPYAYEMMEEAAEAGHPLAQFNYAQVVLDRQPSLEGEERAMGYSAPRPMRGSPMRNMRWRRCISPASDAPSRTRRKPGAGWRWRPRGNHDTAQLDLATMMVGGRGGEVDFEAGFSWMKRAAEMGNVAARNRLAKLYRSGIGVEGDSLQAAAWYLLARQSGLFDPEMEDHLYGLDEEEIAEAQQRAATLR